MKKINDKIKNLFSIEINLQMFKIISVLIVYLIVFSIFKAGYDYQNITKIKTKTEAPKSQEYKYFVTINGKQKQYNSNSSRALFNVIDSIDNLNMDYVEYYEGKQIVSLNGNKNFKISLNGEVIENNFFSSEKPNLDTRSKIEITIY